MSVIATPATGEPATFLGHPRGLLYLFSTELWERFAPDDRAPEGERAHDVSKLPHRNQHRYGQAGQRRRRDSQSDRENSSRNHHQILSVRRFIKDGHKRRPRLSCCSARGQIHLGASPRWNHSTRKFSDELGKGQKCVCSGVGVANGRRLGAQAPGERAR